MAKPQRPFRAAPPFEPYRRFSRIARLSRKKTIVVSAALLAVCCQGLKDRYATTAWAPPPISFLSNKASLSHNCAHCCGGMNLDAAVEIAKSLHGAAEGQEGR